MRKCPICSSNKNKLIFTQPFSSSWSHNISECSNCGFIYVKNTPRQEFYDGYYKNMSKYELERDHQLHSKYVQIINKFIVKDKKIIDIGCSTGHLLHLLKKNNYKHLYGIEPSLLCKKIAKEKFGISIETSTLFKYKTKTKFDLVILSMVLEHISNLELTIKKARSLLADDGYIFISVPDAGNFYKNFEEPFGEFSVEHINFFSIPYLHFLMRKEENIFIRIDKNNIFSIWKRNKTLKNSVEKYIFLSNDKLNSIKILIDILPKEIIIWGVGSLTQRLLSTTSLSKKVFKFVDNDSKLIGKKFKRKVVISPKDLKNYNMPILISSYRFKDEILKQISKMKLNNKIFTFK